MTRQIKQTATVSQQRKIEIYAPELPIGATVEVTVRVTTNPVDTTEYLLSTEANRRHLLEAVKQLEDPANYVHLESNT